MELSKMNLRMKLLPILPGILLIICLGCAKPPLSQPETVIAMKKTGCYGPCAVYEIELRNDRTLIYKGSKNVPVTGDSRVRISKKEYDDIINQFIQAEFFDFKSNYTSHIPDFPTVFIEFHYEGKDKKIKDYYGAPQELKNLEAAVENLVRTRIWNR